jgi:hypothetical protein
MYKPRAQPSPFNDDSVGARRSSSFMGGSTARLSMHQRRRARQLIEYRRRAGPSNQPGDMQVPNRGYTTPFIRVVRFIRHTNCTVVLCSPFLSVKVTTKLTLRIQYTVLGLNEG